MLDFAFASVFRAEVMYRRGDLVESEADARAAYRFLLELRWPSELERGRHEPSLSVLRAIAAALDTSLGPMLVRAGVLDDDGHNDRAGDTETAIERDPALSEPPRIALLSVYRSSCPAVGESE